MCIVLLAGFRGGGAERVVASLAKTPPGGAHVVLLSNRGPDDDLYPVGLDVERRVLNVSLDERALGSGRFLRNALAVSRLVIRTRRVLRSVEPSVVLAMLTTANLLTIIAAFGLDVRVVVSERNDVGRDEYPRPVRMARRLLYRHADVVTANSSGAVEAMRGFVPEAKLEFVPNAVETPEVAAAPHESTAIIAVARLVEHKQHALLVDAFSRLETAGRLGGRAQDWTLTLVGEGPERNALEALADGRGVAQRMTCVGYVDDPDPWYRQAAIFVITSRYEGMPNALLEAMAHGLACVASDGLSGARAVVDDGVTGLLFRADDPDDLADKLARLAREPQLRMTLGAAARHAMTAHAPARINKAWERVLFAGESA